MFIGLTPEPELYEVPAHHLEVKMSISMIVTILAGLAVLFFGRQLFWLFVAVAGFAAGFQLASNFLGDESELLILLIAVLIGVLGALLAIFLRYVAVAVAGFTSGAYLGVQLLPWLDTNSDLAYWVLFVAGGVIGALLLIMLFDWALIGLSAVTGATMLVPLTNFAPNIQLVLFLVLVIVGIVVQYYFLPGEEVVTRRRTVVHTTHTDTV